MTGREGRGGGAGTMTVDLRGTSAVVIGASDGIGRAIALGFAASGATVVGTARTTERMSATVALAQDLPGAIEAAPCDVLDPDSIDALVALVMASHGAPRALVNCAGTMVVRPALELSVADWDLILDTHLRGAFLVARAFAGPMRDVGQGHIIHLSSTWAVTVGHGRSAYSAAKAGLSHLTAALALEWAPYGIRVNAIAPGATRTPAADERIRSDPSREAYLLERIPLGRIAEPEDIVGAALFLASASADHITGETILIDGGWRTAK